PPRRCTTTRRPPGRHAKHGLWLAPRALSWSTYVPSCPHPQLSLPSGRGSMNRARLHVRQPRSANHELHGRWDHRSPARSPQQHNEHVHSRRLWTHRRERIAMDEPSDGITEAGEETLRSMLTSAARAGEHISRRREATKRAAAEKDSQTAREMQSRLEAEKQLGQAQLDKTHDSQWCEQAPPAEVAEAYLNARACGPEDPAAAEAAEHMRQQVRERYDVDLRNFSDAEPDRFQRPPRTEEQMAEEERQGRAKAAEAEALM